MESAIGVHCVLFDILHGRGFYSVVKVE